MRNLILFTVLLFSGFISAQTFDFTCATGTSTETYELNDLEAANFTYLSNTGSSTLFSLNCDASVQIRKTDEADGSESYQIFLVVVDNHDIAIPDSLVFSTDDRWSSNAEWVAAIKEALCGDFNVEVDSTVDESGTINYTLKFNQLITTLEIADTDNPDYVEIPGLTHDFPTSYGVSIEDDGSGFYIYLKGTSWKGETAVFTEWIGDVIDLSSLDDETPFNPDGSLVEGGNTEAGVTYTYGDTDWYSDIFIYDFPGEAHDTYEAYIFSNPLEAGEYHTFVEYVFVGGNLEETLARVDAHFAAYDTFEADIATAGDAGYSVIPGNAFLRSHITSGSTPVEYLINYEIGDDGTMTYFVWKNGTDRDFNAITGTDLLALLQSL